jgi:hypothetical protein
MDTADAMFGIVSQGDTNRVVGLQERLTFERFRVPEGALRHAIYGRRER